MPTLSDSRLTELWDSVDEDQSQTVSFDEYRARAVPVLRAEAAREGQLQKEHELAMREAELLQVEQRTRQSTTARYEKELRLQAQQHERSFRRMQEDYRQLEAESEAAVSQARVEGLRRLHREMKRFEELHGERFQARLQEEVGASPFSHRRVATRPRHAQEQSPQALQALQAPCKAPCKLPASSLQAPCKLPAVASQLSVDDARRPPLHPPVLCVRAYEPLALTQAVHQRRTMALLAAEKLLVQDVSMHWTCMPSANRIRQLHTVATAFEKVALAKVHSHT